MRDRVHAALARVLNGAVLADDHVLSDELLGKVLKKAMLRALATDDFLELINAELADVLVTSGLKQFTEASYGIAITDVGLGETGAVFGLLGPGVGRSESKVLEVP